MTSTTFKRSGAIPECFNRLGQTSTENRLMWAGSGVMIPTLLVATSCFVVAFIARPP